MFYYLLRQTYLGVQAVWLYLESDTVDKQIFLNQQLRQVFYGFGHTTCYFKRFWGDSFYKLKTLKLLLLVFYGLHLILH